MFLFSTVRRKMHFFICLQCPSCLFVSYLSGLTNSIEWFTVLWMYPYLAKFEYAFQRSLTMVVPGSIHSWICFNKVFSLRSSTVTIKHFLESSSMPPKTHWPSTTCSRWYFFFYLGFIDMHNFFRSSKFLTVFKQRHFAKFSTKHVPIHSSVMT